jgi:DNA invertase Pin-like site-specific DNA recombinase
MAKQRAVLYGRLSKEDVDKINEGDDSQSIKNQRLLLTEYALEHGFEIIDWYYDDDYSGMFSDRPDFERLIKDAQAGKFDVVIAKSQSRFTRNMEHMEKYLHSMFPIWGVRFIGVVDNADTSVASNKKARQINGLINEWYCEDLSENIKAVFKAKMKDGQYIAAHPPYGYLKDPSDNHKLIVDDYAAEIVRRIYAMYISGMGKSAIGAKLTKEGILIPSEYKRQVLNMNYHNANESLRSDLWSYQTIHQILNNEAYTGVMVQSRFSTISYKSRKKKKLPESEWIKIPNAFEAIIDIETWDTAQKFQKQRTRSVNAGTSNGIFSGMLRCADCNKPMSRAYHRRTHEFTGYCCSTYKKYGNQFCSQHPMNNNDLEKVVLETIKQEAKKILTLQDIDELNNLDMNNTHHNNTLLNQTRIMLQNKVDKIDKYLKKVYEDYVDELLDKTEYLSLKEQYNSEKQDILRQINDIDESLNHTNEKQMERDEWIERFKNYMNVDELTRDMVVELIDKIEIGNNHDVHIFFKFHQGE